MRGGAVMWIAALGALAGCSDELPASWSIDIARVVAVRATPPHVAPGEVGRFTGLLANADGTVSEVEPTRASAAGAPGDLFVAVHFNIDHWQVDGLDDAALAPARAELGLAASAPVPIDVTLQFPGPLYATKTVWLGDHADNATAGAVTIDGQPADDDIALTRGATLALVIEVAASDRVRWLTSCGTLEDEAAPRARLVVDERCSGALVVVVRDANGGVAWRTFTVHAQ